MRLSAREGNEIVPHIVREIGPLPSEHMCWYVTERCNYSCKFCYRYQEGNNEVSLSDARNILDQLVLLGISKITFTGEPLLVSWIFDAVEYAKSLGMYTTIMTNGSRLDLDRIPDLVNLLDRLSLPVDGSTEDINIKMTRPRGHLNGVRRIAERLLTVPIRLRITTVVTSINWADVSSTACLVRGLGASEWKLYQFRPNRGEALVHQRDFEIEDGHFIRAVASAHVQLVGSGVKISSLSLRDRYSDFFLMRPDGTLEVSTGDAYSHLGNLLTTPLDTIKSRYAGIVERLMAVDQNVCFHLSLPEMHTGGNHRVLQPLTPAKGHLTQNGVRSW